MSGGTSGTGTSPSLKPLILGETWDCKRKWTTSRKKESEEKRQKEHLPDLELSPWLKKGYKAREITWRGENMQRNKKEWSASCVKSKKQLNEKDPWETWDNHLPRPEHHHNKKEEGWTCNCKTQPLKRKQNQHPSRVTDPTDLSRSNMTIWSCLDLLIQGECKTTYTLTTHITFRGKPDHPTN